MIRYIVATTAISALALLGGSPNVHASEQVPLTDLSLVEVLLVEVTTN